MEMQRLFLLIALFFVLSILWGKWQEAYHPAVVADNTNTSTTHTLTPTAETDIKNTPLQKKNSDTPEIPAIEKIQPDIEKEKIRKNQYVEINTDVLRVFIDKHGANIQIIDLLAYPVELEHPEKAVRLLSDSKNQFFIAQSGLLVRDEYAQWTPKPNSALYSTKQPFYTLVDDTLEVPFVWQSEDRQFEVIKRYIFHPGRYDIDVIFEIKNNTAQNWQGYIYRQLQRIEAQSNASVLHTYTGAMIAYDEDGYKKISFEDIDNEVLKNDPDYQKTVAGGWISMIQHYFLAAWVFNKEHAEQYYTKVLKNKNHYIVGSSRQVKVEQGKTARFNEKLFVGPKLQEKMENLATGLSNTVDYGILTIIARPLYWLLQKLHNFLGNWGWSIIFLTIIIKALFYKLSEASYRSMASMRKLSPRLKSIQERYASDPQGKNQALMELYRTEKINPLGGCLPILVQIPVFISLYWVLLESVELRQADFMLWITDLSSKDPYFILPLIMGVSMIIQQKLNPTPLDPIQEKVMMILPIIFTVFFAFFPSGLVLYWVTNNVLSIAQQAYITKKVGA